MIDWIWANMNIPGQNQNLHPQKHSISYGYAADTIWLFKKHMHKTLPKKRDQKPQARKCQPHQSVSCYENCDVPTPLKINQRSEKIREVS